MKLFTYKKNGLVALALAFNRGHAVKMLAKEIERQGMKLEKNDPVTEISLEDEKGKVIIL